MSDDGIADLLQQCAAQDRTAFRKLYSQSSSKLFGLLIRILGDRAEAEDALQEVFTRVWLKAARFDGTRGTGMAWLVALARNHAIDRLRARPQSTGELPEEIADDSLRPETRLIANGELARMASCFDQLESDRAQAVRGAYLQGLSYTDLAARFDVPLNTMRTWLRRSLLSLRDCLNQ